MCATVCWLTISQFFSGEWEEEKPKTYGKEAIGVEQNQEVARSSSIKVKEKSKLKVKDTISRAEQKYVKQQIEIQNKEKEKREAQCAKRILQRERKRKSRAIMKRTKKGQPVMHLQVNQLLKKIENDEIPKKKWFLQPLPWTVKCGNCEIKWDFWNE